MDLRSNTPSTERNIVQKLTTVFGRVIKILIIVITNNYLDNDDKSNIFFTFTNNNNNESYCFS